MRKSYVHEHNFRMCRAEHARAEAGGRAFGRCVCGATALAVLKPGIASRAVPEAPDTVVVEVEEEDVESFMAALADNGFESKKGES